MSPVARRRTLLISTALLLLGAISLLTWIVVQQPIEGCLPSDIAFGRCEPPDTLTTFVQMGLMVGVLYLTLSGVLLLIRAMFRSTMWLKRRLVGRQREAAGTPADVTEQTVVTDPRMGSQSRTHRRGMRMILVMVAMFAAGLAAGRTGLLAGPADNAEFSLIHQAWDVLHEEYVRADELDSGAMAYAAIDAMTAAVGDTQHTRFLPPDEAAAEADDLSDGVSAVHWTTLPGTHVALIRIDEFSEGVADDLADVLHATRIVRSPAIVLDLRENPGGVFDEAVGVASEFVPSGIVIEGRDAAGVVRPVSVDRAVVDPTTPMVVLVDDYTASAAEVVASALQEAGRATLVGVTTFGTGTALDWFELDDGSVLAVGTIQWLTRTGRSVWHTGVVPDVTVARPADVLPLTPSEVVDLDPPGLAASGDTQLLRALELLAP